MFPSDASQRMKEQPGKSLEEYRILETGVNFDSLSVEKFQISSSRKEVEMKSDNIFISEVNVDLWDRALVTAIGDISYNFYPNHSVVQKVINHTLNSEVIDVGLLSCFFTKLVLFHPPKSNELQKYYWTLLTDRYLVLNPIKEAEGNAFWGLNDALTNCLKNEESVKGSKDKSCEGGLINKSEKMESLISLTKMMLGDVEDWNVRPEKKEKIGFDCLPPSDQVQRILIVLEFFSAVLEANFTEIVREDSYSSTNGCLLSGLLWDIPEDVGLINEKVRKLVQAWFLMEKASFCHSIPIHRKLLTLLAEIIRHNEDDDGSYSFLGPKLNFFAYEVSLTLKDRLKENINAVRMLKPHWMRMLVCSRLLTRLTGKTCPPELATACDVLDYVTKDRRKSTGKGVKSRRISEDAKSCECGLRKTKKARRSVDVDPNSCNSTGWTASHEDVLNGHEKCVEDLLAEKTVDERRKGADGLAPLMCDAAADHAGISKRLEHSGPDLLTDVDDGDPTASDMGRSKDVSDVLESFSTEVEPTVDLCVQLAESYLISNRIWDSWICQRKSRRVRQETGVHANVDRLTSIVTELVEVKEIARYVEPLRRILNFKNCSE